MWIWIKIENVIFLLCQCSSVFSKGVYSVTTCSLDVILSPKKVCGFLQKHTSCHSFFCRIALTVLKCSRCCSCLYHIQSIFRETHGERIVLGKTSLPWDAMRQPQVVSLSWRKCHLKVGCNMIILDIRQCVRAIVYVLLKSLTCFLLEVN